MENQTAEVIERRVSAVLREAARCLTSYGIDSGSLDAEVLLSHVLGVNREQLLVAAHAPMDEAQSRAYERLLSRRLEREPTAYITGKREFWSLDIHVTPDVLIPRPETELLVELSLALSAEWRAGKPMKILDLGTGSGAIAVALATELAGAKIFATDISAAALAVAAGNALRNDVAGRISFVQSDLFEAFETAASFDLIVANPPYIRHSDIDALEPEVSRWEPRGALDGGLDGLDYYRRMATEGLSYLVPSGAIAVEIGAGMGDLVATLFKAGAGCAKADIYKDYAGNERVVVARKAAAIINSI